VFVTLSHEHDENYAQNLISPFAGLLGVPLM